LVAKLPLACGRAREAATRSRTLSEISAFIDRLPLPPGS